MERRLFFLLAWVACQFSVGGAFDLVASIGYYPGYNGLAPSGTIVASNIQNGIKIKGTMTGLPANTTGGWHIHSGFSCSVAADVGGHFYEGMANDPWTTTYTSDAHGVASIDTEMGGFSLSGIMPVAGRALVIHDASTRIGCGPLHVTTGAVTHMGLYPGYTGTDNVRGTILTTYTGTGLTIVGTLGGLPASTTAGFHIHSGHTCDDEDGVGGHYYEGMNTDPWTTTYTSDAHGAATISLTMSDFTLVAAYPVLGRALVVHSSTDKISCGLIETGLSSSTMSTTTPSPTLAPSEPSPTPAPEPSKTSPDACGSACKWGPLAAIAGAAVFMFGCMCMDLAMQSRLKSRSAHSQEKKDLRAMADMRDMSSTDLERGVRVSR